MTAIHYDQHGAPYADAAMLYRQAGWEAPLPVRGKYPPPLGWTGVEGRWPSTPDIYAWCEDRGFDNIGLRLPPTVIGLDVDNYADKRGAATLAECEAKWGPLPQTWRSTSRSDGTSGIRLFRIPEGFSWPGQLPGGGVELVRWDHRYVMSWPSIHPEKRVYRWTMDGVTFLNIPKPEELPALPQTWVDGLVRGVYTAEVKAKLGEGAAGEWLAGLNGAAQLPCPFLLHKAATLVQAMAGVTSSRHEAALSGVLDLVRLAEEGHPGILGLLANAGENFTAAVSGDGSRTANAAWGEWSRLLEGAVGIICNKERTPSLGDPCIVLSDPPWHPGDPIPEYRPTPRMPQPLQDTPSPLGSGEPRGTGEAAPTSTWGEQVDISAALDGRLPAIPPAELARVDGVMLLYPGKVNGLLGPSESGKTWIVLLAAAQAVAAGRSVVILDFEDTVIGLVERLRALGVADDLIRSNVVYLAPSEPLTLATQADLMRVLNMVHPALIILDGVNAAMTTMGLDMNSNTDATNFHINLLLPMSRTGAAVVVVDHTPKNDHEGISKGGIGAQAKRAAMTGAAIKVEVIKQFSRGHAGLLKLIVDKDRGGHVRMATTNGVIGIAHLEPGEDGSLSVRIEADETSVGEDGGFRPTTLMGRVAEYLTANPGANSRALMQQHFGRDKFVKDAIELLVSEGYVSRANGPNRAVFHSMIRVWPASAARCGPVRPKIFDSDSAGRGSGRTSPQAAPDAAGTHLEYGRTHQDHFDYPENDPADD